jgi:hypothetical protein
MNKNESNIMLPKKITAENGMKQLLSDEFYEEISISCPYCGGDFADNGGEFV